MACQKVCKQGRDDIIVKVSLQSLIPASFSHRFHISFTLSFYILIFFKSLYVSSVHCGYPQIMLAHKVLHSVWLLVSQSACGCILKWSVWKNPTNLDKVCGIT